jgi:hypothetical protein
MWWDVIAMEDRAIEPLPSENVPSLLNFYCAQAIVGWTMLARYPG